MLVDTRFEFEWQRRICKNYNSTLRDKRIGVMLHYDDSANDKSAVEWFFDPRCQVSYNYLVLDDGKVVELVDQSHRAWHAGVCRPSSERLVYQDANSAFIGIAAATNSSTPATEAQYLAIAYMCKLTFESHGWDLKDRWRITGHADEAWTRGRRADPYGYVSGRPILDPDRVWRLMQILRP